MLNRIKQQEIDNFCSKPARGTRKEDSFHFSNLIILISSLNLFNLRFVTKNIVT